VGELGQLDKGEEFGEVDGEVDGVECFIGGEQQIIGTGVRMTCLGQNRA
jgi:hypothetical protein